jgi:cell division protein FtsB
LKRAFNSYSAKPYSARSHVTASSLGVRSRTAWMFPRIPNFVWLAMIILAIGALSYSAYSRSDQQEQEALESYNSTAARVENAKSLNRQIKEQTARIRRDPEISAQSAQDQLRLVRRNEVVVSLR